MKFPKLKLDKDNIVSLVYVLFGAWLILSLVVVEDLLFRISVGISAMFWLITITEYMNNRRHMKDEQ